MLVAEFILLDVLLSMFVFFLWIMWLWLLFAIWGDVFRRDDIGGGMKALWLVFTLVFPFLGGFVYVATQNEGMTKRGVARIRRDREDYAQYTREMAGTGVSGGADEIERGQELLTRGVITQAEFDVLKANALAP